MARHYFSWEIPIKPGGMNYIPVREAIRQAIIEQELNPKVVAERAGLQRHWLYNYLTGSKDSVDASGLAKVLEDLGLPLDILTSPAPAKRRQNVESLDFEDQKAKPGELRFGGIIERGAWRERPTKGSVAVAPFPGVPPDQQIAFVAGEKLGDIANPHDRLICVLGESHIVEGCFVVVTERRTDLVQHGLYEVHVVDQNTLELWPFNADAVKNLVYRRGEDNALEITAVMIAVVPDKR
jgi:hypothetical protein